MDSSFSVGEQLPEGAVQLDDSGVSTAQSVAVSVGPRTSSLLKLREPMAVVLPDGRHVGMSVPKAAISQYLARILRDIEFKDPKLMAQEQMRVKALLYVSDIDGVPVERPMDYLGLLKLEQDLGDQGVDLVFFAFIQHFPPIEEHQLVIVKKS